MGTLFRSASDQSVLHAAWRRIKANGQVSKADETRIAVDMFDRDANRQIWNIQRRLRKGEFQFDPQKGVLKKKGSGGKRGIVMASVHNRIVERALLDTLQSRSDFVRTVIEQPTSVGGVPHRSVPHGLQQIRDAHNSGKLYFIRSDISGFFDHVPRREVIAKLSDDVSDPEFISLLEQATLVTLANETALGEDRRSFPTDAEGVAQGSPLSPLFGNILLHDFDVQLNGRGVSCIRFIDDFVILAESETKAKKAFESARSILAALGLGCHDPFAVGADTDKTGHGLADVGFDFLGNNIRPGLCKPSRKAIGALEETIRNHLRSGRSSIVEVRRERDSFAGRNRMAQTLVVIDRVIKGWGDAFAYCNCPDIMRSLDERIEAMLDDFRRWYAGRVKSEDWKNRRRMAGVCLLEDVPTKSLDDVPFFVKAGPKVRKSVRSLTVSTDGSVIARRGQRRDTGSGGWSFVVHETGLEGAGRISQTTNNRMELQAVLEALKATDGKLPLTIRTDSQYVRDGANGKSLVRKNADLWEEYKYLRENRRVEVVWVKGHDGDPMNERADALANQQAMLGFAEQRGRVSEAGLSALS